MASLRFPSLLVCLSSLTVLLISPSYSLTCTSQTFTNRHVYTNCTDLPSLNAYLHWSHNSTTSSLSIAFVAAPAKPDGWIAWAINPTGTGMVGAQSLVAMKRSDGSMAVDTFNISSYSSIVKSNLSFAVSASSAEYSGGVMRIFATIALPEKATTVNQVWQVGPSVTGGMPDKHDFLPANLIAKGTLDLATGSGADTSVPALAPGPGSGSGGEKSAGGKGGASRIGKSNIVFYVFLFLACFVCCF
ncbi:Cytochrome b561 and DOMON domain-containing protein [Actinidia chinensis var. chinensis]|uniref:Cytochrome b561 and DOMON domain-containing protein n=1 Tax=Actinidia chinensis var. chinensis TaxID=1590841 RepID=A0A2R6PPH0_ACTCC|nr:Cytochrome b561 and DOMON domain-containing protein [Actinidia chinensis var. chinensis]